MSIYCTNCKYLEKKITANKSYWRCCAPNSMVSRLNSLYDNPLKSTYCIKCNWYKQQEKKITTEEMIKVMQACIDGKQIQIRNNIMDKWNDVDILIWNWSLYDYRIKPEPKYRPLKPEELIELKGKWLKNKTDNPLAMVTGIDNKEGDVNMLGVWFSVKELYEYWTYEDGTPCGKLEE